MRGDDIVRVRDMARIAKPRRHLGHLAKLTAVAQYLRCVTSSFACIASNPEDTRADKLAFAV
ncbi:MAG TPA: hypothetical protein VNO30_16395 [Kofleriaceae bacterium]|nr:hypothetical protein [Kofleriaceae bacterium]